MNLDTLIPHKPPFRLVSQVLDHAPDWVLAGATIDSDNIFYDADQDGVPTWTSIEFMAQTAAVWVGLVDQTPATAQPAFLISARSVEATIPVFPRAARLQIRVDVNFIDGPIVAFHGKIMQCTDGEPQPVCRAEFSAFRPDSLEEYLRASDPQYIAQVQE